MANGKRGYYAVARGRKPGVYEDWSDCEEQILNFKGAKHKKFLHAADAELWISQYATALPVKDSERAVATTTSEGLPTGAHSQAPSVAPSESSASPNCVSKPNPHKQILASHTSNVHSKSLPTTNPIRTATPPVAPTGGTTTAAPVAADKEPFVVYTDGSSRGNGAPGSKAGVGVWYGENDPRNIAERCPGIQTNNCAELSAIIRALETAPKDCPLTLKTDSAYSMKCLTEYLPNWQRNGFRTADGKSVKNVPLIKYADLLLTERKRVFQQEVRFEKVKGHSGEVGNEGADTLANMGATLPPVPDRDYDSLIKQVIHRINSAASLPSAPASKTAVSSMHTTIAKALETSATPPMQQRQAASTQVSSTHASVPTSAPPSETRNGGQKSSVTSASTTSSRPPPRSDTSGVPGPLKRSQRSQAETVSVERVRTNGSVEMEQRELEMYADCLLSDEEFLAEARELGLCD